MTASVPLADIHEVRHRTPETAATHVPSDRAVPRAVAVGTLMATTPATAREAERILSAAAAGAGLPETVLAAATIDSARGVPVPARAERALRQAVRTARTPDPVPSSTSGPYLLPLREDTEKALGRFFESRLRLSAAPVDPEARRSFEDSLFTLCILMGQPCAPEALHDAVQYAAS
ncbi:DUF5133 domain-containing protein [Streptomyces xanthophaeus]|uniref:DUF5133 domain-containing protein n=1 Tax=Streptomyces xanthophaeus TaxID=67385 RepID=UPI002648BFDF|nr:DUF5133 domain-containing protein [Streptomyces xanthophaeus]WKD36680.1 DUF5133 domain-containing protein [Streptomyces xanthophaeus]